MGYKILFSHFAESRLYDIYDYHSEVANAKIAQKILFQIRDKIKILATNPLIGKREEFLLDRKEGYRQLILTNYKVIYSVNEQSRVIKIADIFDTRQSPRKMKRI